MHRVPRNASGGARGGERHFPHGHSQWLKKWSLQNPGPVLRIPGVLANPRMIQGGQALRIGKGGSHTLHGVNRRGAERE